MCLEYLPYHLVLQAAKRAASETGIVDWSAFEVAAEAAVAAERARRRAASPRAKLQSQSPSPHSHMHPFAAAAVNAAREAAATVTLPGAKRGRASPPPWPNPFAVIASTRAMSPRRVSAAQASNFGSDTPQV